LPKERKELTVEEQYELGHQYLRREGRWVEGPRCSSTGSATRIATTRTRVKAELAIGDVYYKEARVGSGASRVQDFMRMHPRHRDLD
jgi:outer membrane protein assembly factor BamD (BamD/ComL family)